MSTLLALTVWARNCPPIGSGRGMWLAGWFALSAWASNTAVAAPQQFSIQHWLAGESGLPQNAVTAVLQTRDGYIWVGTYSGLARFDGARFKVFDSGTKPELQNSRVTSLCEDSQGALWIGHETGDVTRYHIGQFESVSIQAKWERTDIVAIAPDEHGQIWLMNKAGHIVRTSDNRLLVPERGNVSGLATLVKSEGGTLWVAREGRVSVLKNGELFPAQFDQPAQGYFLQGVCASHDGGLWVASEGSLRKWKGEQHVEQLVEAPWGQSTLQVFREMRNGVLAAGTLADGLFLLLPDKTSLHFGRTNGLSQDWIRALGEDREGNLWVGTGSGGLNMLRAARVQTLVPPDQWEGRAVLSVLAARDGALWVGTEGAGIYRWRDQTWTHFSENEGIANRFVWSLAQDAQGAIRAGTWGGGMFVLHGERFERDPALADLSVPMTAMFAARNGDLWIGTKNGLLRRDSQGGKHWIEHQDGVAVENVRAIVEAPDNTLWFGMLGGGLGQLSQGRLRQFRKADGLSSDFVQCLMLDREGALWIGTAGGGMNRFKAGRFASVGVAQGFPNNVICHIEEDDRGYFWLSSFGGIFRVSKSELDACAEGLTNEVQCLTYGRGEGMSTLECSGGSQPSGTRTPDGRLWIPTSSGLVAVNPDDVQTNPLPPPVVIEEMRVEGVSTDIQAGRLRIPPGRQRFEFRCTGLSFVAPEKVRFRYWLEGLEDSWQEASPERTITYSHLLPGNYVFHVTACNNDGFWNETGASQAFEVLPHFWQTWTFRSAAALAIVASVAWGVRFDTRRRMRRKLERLERQRAIERERTRIAKDIHDDLGASLTRITMLSETVRAEVEHPLQAAQDLDRINQTARDLTRALDEIVWAVNPQHDTLDSLAGYLCRFAQDFLGTAHLRCRLDVPVDLPSWPVTAEVRHNLFLAFKEGLHNVVQHAGATEVRSCLTLDEAGFRVVIEDNGKGCAAGSSLLTENPPANRPGRGNGLSNMRRRLEEIGGRFELESATGRGTRVTFWLPVPHPSR